MAGNATVYTAKVISIADRTKSKNERNFNSFDAARHWVNSQPNVRHSRITTGNTWPDIGNVQIHKSLAYQAHLDSKGGK